VSVIVGDEEWQDWVPVVGGALLVALWLNPVSYGPTPSVIQWVFTWVGAAIFWLFTRVAHPGSFATKRVIAVAWITAAAVSAVMGLMQYFGTAGIWGSFINSAEV
jgi:hypothetical protein